MSGVWTGIILSKRDRVGRGGNWNVSDKYNLTSSARSPSGISSRWDGTGFRAILVFPDFAPPLSSTAKGLDLPPNLAGDQRKLAESVLSKAGSVILWRDSGSLHIERMEKLPPGPIRLRHVDQVTGDFTEDDATLLGSCYELASLRIHRGQLTRLPLESWPALQRFELSECRIALSGVRDLAGKLSLSQVLIGSTPVGGDVIALLATCPKLEHLTLAKMA